MLAPIKNETLKSKLNIFNEIYKNMSTSLISDLSMNKISIQKQPVA